VEDAPANVKNLAHLRRRGLQLDPDTMVSSVFVLEIDDAMRIGVADGVDLGPGQVERRRPGRGASSVAARILETADVVCP
jgi:hypothetical protein